MRVIRCALFEKLLQLFALAFETESHDDVARFEGGVAVGQIAAVVAHVATDVDTRGEVEVLDGLLRDARVLLDFVFDDVGLGNAQVFD